MINLMYLVLTALLALNVSAEILNAFKTVERSLTSTNNTINASTETLMASFIDLKADPKTAVKAAEWEPKAIQAQQLTKDMMTYINGLKDTIMKQADFDPKRKGDSTFKEDDQNVATRIMVTEGKGAELRKRLEQYKKDMAAITNDPKVAQNVAAFLKQIDLNIPPSKNNHGGEQTWQSAYFSMVPTVAATTMLTKFQNDLKTAENNVIKEFHEQVGKVKVRFNNYAALKSQSSNYLMPGQELQIQAGVGAYSSDAKPTITIGGQVIPVNEKGVAEWKTNVSSLGVQSIPITYKWTDQDGKEQTFVDKIQYEVGQSNAAIALPQMNVMYVGWNNEVVVSGGGVGAEKIGLTSNGQGGANVIPNGNGKFIVKVSSQSDNLLLTATDKTSGKALGSLSFRVRLMPDPGASVGGKVSGDGMSAAALAAQPGVAANIRNFPLDLKFEVVRFKVVLTNEDGDIISLPVQGNVFTNDVKNRIRGQKPGDIVTIEDIYVRYPDGGVKKVPSLLYNIL